MTYDYTNNFEQKRREYQFSKNDFFHLLNSFLNMNLIEDRTKDWKQ